MTNASIFMLAGNFLDGWASDSSTIQIRWICMNLYVRPRIRFPGVPRVLFSGTRSTLSFRELHSNIELRPHASLILRHIIDVKFNNNKQAAKQKSITTFMIEENNLKRSWRKKDQIHRRYAKQNLFREIRITYGLLLQSWITLLIPRFLQKLK